MIEYMHARVRVSNFTMFTVVTLIERVGTMPLLAMESTMQININVPNEPTSIVCNSSTGVINLRATNLVRHER